MVVWLVLHETHRVLVQVARIKLIVMSNVIHNESMGCSKGL